MCASSSNSCSPKATAVSTFWAKSHVTWPEGTPHSQRPSTCASAPLSEAASRSSPWPERGRAPRPARWPRWGGSHRRDSPATRLAAPAPAPHVGQLAMRWHTRHHDRRWHVVRSGLGQLGSRWPAVCESVLSGLRAHTRLSQARETRGDGCGATEHTAASPAPWIAWRAQGWPDPPRHPIAVPSCRGAPHDHADAPSLWGGGLLCLRALRVSPPH
jgi:hypothetical protein